MVGKVRLDTISTYFPQHLNALTDCSRISRKLAHGLIRGTCSLGQTRFRGTRGTDRRTVRRIDKRNVHHEKMRNFNEKDNFGGIRVDKYVDMAVHKPCFTLGIGVIH